jgi:uncharacterized repeat protein (TIGR03803 family)
MDEEESMQRRTNPWFPGTALLLILITMLLGVGAGAQNKYKTLYKFTGGADGNSPRASLVRDQAGNLYGTTEFGGDHKVGTVFKLTPNSDGSWTESVLYSFCSLANCIDGAQPAGGLIFDASGNLYGTTVTGGNFNIGTVYELTPANGAWTESVLYSFCSLAICTDGGSPTGGVIFDPSGNLYGTTQDGGNNDKGTVYELTPANGTWTERVLHSFCSDTTCSDGDEPDAGVIFDASGSLYGTTLYGGKEAWGDVFKLTPSGGTWTISVLHTFTGGNDGGVPAGGLVMDRAGNLYGMSAFGGLYRHGTVFKLSQATGKWKGAVLHNFANGDGAQPLGGVTLDSSGNIYGMTPVGGDLNRCNRTGCGVVFKLAPKSKGGWTEAVLHRFLDHPGALPVAELIFDSAGNSYGTTFGDQVKTFGSVFEITP